MPIHIERAVNEVTTEAGAGESESADPRWRRLQEVLAIVEAKERERQRFAAEGFDD